MDPVATQYLDREGAALAYQVVGDGPADIVCFYEAFQHLDLSLTDPDINYNVERMASFSRQSLISSARVSACQTKSRTCRPSSSRQKTFSRSWMPSGCVGRPWSGGWGH